MAQDSTAEPLPTSTAPVPTYQIILSPEAYRGLRVLGRSAYPLGGPSAGELRVLVPTWEQLKERAKSGDKSAAAVIAKWEGVAHRAALLNPDILSVL